MAPTTTVSIHAPAWGATRGFCRLAATSIRFNPRARVGRDGQPHLHLFICGGFNPRARVGRDSNTSPNVATPFEFQSTRPRGARHDMSDTPDRDTRVSIHAPAWGATMLAFSFGPRKLRFNPRARVGRDGQPQAAMPVSGRFQSTRPRGARLPSLPLVRASNQSFNPRARVGRDGCAAIYPLAQAQFQSTRPRGARPLCAVAKPTVRRVSIHAPAWGATALSCRPAGLDEVSIHAPAWGATPSIRAAFLTVEVSIHAPAWGATIDGRHDSYESSRFNPRARVGRDRLLPPFPS